ncbi:E3 ubiquitin-protein ligase XIAP-like [Microplitis mediator]|uniref:E3 ubiquitin-protein ligase XIAP-like n=1 Tax=Microplitis mediator TaxID=375433 RepID=UPI002554B952|nr:E3 ubiquitin-protein ligase XIAP-like [Microplitis mediator]
MTSTGERGATLSDYRFEGAIFRSFVNWPLTHPQPRCLAAAGFYYTGVIDSVKCFFCGVEICIWEEEDNPRSEHQRWQGNCRFIRNLPSGNIPLNEDVFHLILPSDEVTGVRPSYEESEINYTYASTARLHRTGMTRRTNMAHSTYSHYQTRLESFKDWSPSIKQTKEQLAEAGFFYTGTGDQTLCYHCGGGLKDWEPEDDPWKQHAKWFKSCFYVRFTKEQSFIDSVMGKLTSAPVQNEITEIELPPCLTLEGNRDARTCKICYEEELGIIFFPCGHVVACIKCTPAITTCVVCRGPIILTARAILA